MRELVPTTTAIGAEVRGIDLSDMLNDETIAWISDALVERKVLMFRDQTLDRAKHLELGRRFGVLEEHPFAKFIPAFNSTEMEPEIIVIESKPGGSGRGSDFWHADVTFQEKPAMGAILRCVVCPPVGGDTLWADMERAYELLDDKTRERIEDLQAENDWHPHRRALSQLGTDEATMADLKAAFPPAVHPVVRTHPVSGRKCLHVNSNFTVRILGIEADESARLLDHLYSQVIRPELQVRYRWEPGSVVFWDNRNTQHYAVFDYAGQHRLMERVTISGDKPF